MTNQNLIDESITVREVAQRLNVSERSVRRWISQGKIEKHQFGRSIRVSKSELNRFVRRAFS